MSYQAVDQVDHMVEDQEMENFGPEFDEENYDRDGGELGVDEYSMLTRLEQYKNYENVPLSGESVDKECKPMKKGGSYYEFFHNTRLVKPTILHFQRRNLIWATSKHDVYLLSNSSVMHWSSLTGNLSEPQFFKTCSTY